MRRDWGNDQIKIAFMAVVAVCAAAMLANNAGCKGAEWRAVAGVKSAGDMAGKTLFEGARAKHDECKNTHGAQTEEYADCVREYREALTAWVTYAKPSINAALRLTIDALLIAEKARSESPPPWQEYLKPAVCAIATIVQGYTHLFGEHAATIRGYLDAVKGVTCGK